MSIPEDENIDFEKFSLSGDSSGLLEPIADKASEQLLPEQEPEAEAKVDDFPADEEGKAEQAESDGGEAAVQATSKHKSFLEKLSAADPFTVMLAAAAAALLIAVLCCLVELGRYGFDIGAKNAKQTVTMAAPMDTPHLLC